MSTFTICICLLVLTGAHVIEASSLGGKHTSRSLEQLKQRGFFGNGGRGATQSMSPGYQQGYPGYPQAYPGYPQGMPSYQSATPGYAPRPSYTGVGASYAGAPNVAAALPATSEAEEQGADPSNSGGDNAEESSGDNAEESTTDSKNPPKNAGVSGKDLNAEELAKELGTSITMQKNTLSTLSGQVTQLSKDLEQQKETKKEEDDEAASEADSGAVHMTIKYPGSETAGKTKGPLYSNTEMKTFRWSIERNSREVDA
eukprot:GHVS01004954.1.p2 GENE.GHVS01004954.1~~GHVS01004954.1.p2  ORF type:complete len:257 (-),score=28.91 GHVS01004954.1:1651-2421(-)